MHDGTLWSLKLQVHDSILGNQTTIFNTLGLSAPRMSFEQLKLKLFLSSFDVRDPSCEILLARALPFFPLVKFLQVSDKQTPFDFFAQSWGKRIF